MASNLFAPKALSSPTDITNILDRDLPSGVTFVVDPQTPGRERSKYCLYMDNGVQCSGHYEDGRPMPLHIRARLFLVEYGLPIEHIDYVCSLVRMCASRNYRTHHIKGVTPEQMAVGLAFHERANYFGLPTYKPGTAGVVMAHPIEIEKAFQPRASTSGRTPTSDEPMANVAEVLQIWERAQTLLKVPKAIAFGPVSVSLEDAEPDTQVSLEDTEPKEETQEESNPTTPTSTGQRKKRTGASRRRQRQVRKRQALRFSSAEPRYSLEQIQTKWEEYCVSEDTPELINEDRNPLELFNLQPSMELQLKVENKVLRMTLDNKVTVDTIVSEYSKVVTKNERGVLVYAPPNTGKSAWLIEKGIDIYIVDTDDIGLIDATECARLIDNGISVITNRIEFLDIIDCDICFVCHDGGARTIAERIKPKLEHKHDDETIYRWAKDIERKRDYSSWSKLILLDEDEYLSDQHHSLREFFMQRFKRIFRRKNRSRGYFLVDPM